MTNKRNKNNRLKQIKKKNEKKNEKIKNDDKLKLKDLTIKTLKKFQIEIALRLKSLRDDKIIKIKYEKKIIMIEKIIRYFYFYF